MRECAWPRGCNRDRSLVLGEGYEKDLCFWHYKIYPGLVEVDARAQMRPLLGVRAGETFSDEQRELAETLSKLGAEPEVVAAALAQQRPKGRRRVY